MDKIATRKILKAFSDGQMTWRETCCDLDLDHFSELMTLLNEFDLTFAEFPEQVVQDAKDFALPYLQGEE